MNPDALTTQEPKADGPWAVRVERIVVRPTRIVAEVRVSEERFCTATPELIAALLPEFPHLLEHDCVNGEGPTFGAVAAHASLPHLMEHLVIEQQAAADAGASEVLYVGVTRWTDRAAREARIEVSYACDLQVLDAFRVASERLNALLCAR